ncbi:hypothetical protein RJT34_30420 [Clitoria ternatea]|uniref:Nodulin homeobox N-terminal domain-containing protein n=1 Tax=Clitoria ternatea TaxID=43366 RepID=A0AAN9I2L8_CLITE
MILLDDVKMLEQLLDLVFYMLIVLGVVQEPQQVVSTIPSLFHSSDLADKAEGTYDVLVCGGILGIFIATALCAWGLRVAIVKRNALKGVILVALRHCGKECSVLQGFHVHFPSRRKSKKIEEKE